MDHAPLALKAATYDVEEANRVTDGEAFAFNGLMDLLDIASTFMSKGVRLTGIDGHDIAVT